MCKIVSFKSAYSQNALEIATLLMIDIRGTTSMPEPSSATISKKVSLRPSISVEVGGSARAGKPEVILPRQRQKDC